MWIHVKPWNKGQRLSINLDIDNITMFLVNKVSVPNTIHQPSTFLLKNWFFSIFPYKYIGKSIWPLVYCLIKFGRPQVNDALYQVSKFPVFDFGDDFQRAFTIYGNDGHLGQLTRNICIKFNSPKPWRLNMKYGHNLPEGFRAEVVLISEFMWPWNKGHLLTWWIKYLTAKYDTSVFNSSRKYCCCFFSIFSPYECVRMSLWPFCRKINLVSSFEHT